MTYVALVLNEESHSYLVNRYKDKIPNGWEVIAHHVTIHMGSATPVEVLDLGKKYKIKIKTIAYDDKVMAVGVELPIGIQSKNKIPHITLAVNRKNGAKPVMSNNLKNWENVEEFFLESTLEQVD
jgi:tRNA splicing ligase